MSAGALHLNPEEMDLSQLARDVVERLEESARRADCALSSARRGAVTGFWDRLRLDQVLSNLLTNAMKFGAGEPIVVEVSAHGGDDAVLSVTDRGIGIHDDDQRRIFERFERALDGGDVPRNGPRPLDHARDRRGARGTDLAWRAGRARARRSG